MNKKVFYKCERGRVQSELKKNYVGPNYHMIDPSIDLNFQSQTEGTVKLKQAKKISTSKTRIV